MTNFISKKRNKLILTGVFGLLLLAAIVPSSSFFVSKAFADEGETPEPEPTEAPEEPAEEVEAPVEEAEAPAEDSSSISPWLIGAIIVAVIGVIRFAISRRGS